jgi:hypothetical protein
VAALQFAMVRDMLHLVGFVPYDKAAFAAEEEERRRQRLTGLNAAGEREKTTVPKRDLRSLAALDLSMLPHHELPETLQEMCSERARQGGFECVMPSPQPELNDYYAPLFESQRYGNVLNFQFIKQTSGVPREAGARATSSRGARGGSSVGLAEAHAALAANDAGIGNSAPSSSGLKTATSGRAPQRLEEAARARQLPPASARLARTVASASRPVSSRVWGTTRAPPPPPPPPRSAPRSAARAGVNRRSQIRFGGPDV